MDATTIPYEPHEFDEDVGEGEAKPLGNVLRYTVAVVRRNLWLLISIVAAFLVGAVLLTMLQTPRYTATTTIEIADQGARVLGREMEADQQQEQLNQFDVDRFLKTQIDIARSRNTAMRVAQRLNLYASDLFLEAMQSPDVKELPTARQRQEAVIKLLQDNFAADLPEDSRVARLSFDSTNPQLSADIVNAYAAEFIQANLQRKFDSSSYARNFVSEQLQQARARLEASERELNAYARSAGLIRTRDPNDKNDTPGIPSSVTTASLMQLNEAANRAQADRVAAQARWDAERAQPLLSSATVLSDPTVQALRAQRDTLQAQLAEARTRYQEGHPTLTRLEGQIATVGSELTRAANEARNSVRAQYVGALQAENQLRGRVASLRGDTLAEQDRSVRYNTLAREADTNRSIYEGLLQRFRELNASAGITASNLTVIDVAAPPQKPSSPKLLLNLVLALVVGLVLAIVVIYLRDQLDDRIRTPEDIGAKVGLKLLGVTPKLDDGDPKAAIDDPKSPLSESYSALRTSLLYSTATGLPKLLLVTSAQPSEGKTTTSYAVARGFARTGKRVLLVDADLRRPSVHKIAGIKNKVGLSSLLINEATVATAVSATDVDGLTVLPSGPIPPSPAELLSSPRMVALLEQFEGMFDLVVVDSAPVLGLADSPELAGLADGVMMVIEADRGRGGQLKAAVRRLRAMRPVMLGAVLTKFDPTKGSNAYSAYYGYDYYHYQEREDA
jgi:capsular exopolysaccharide synthesis family protein